MIEVFTIGNDYCNRFFKWVKDPIAYAETFRLFLLHGKTRGLINGTFVILSRCVASFDVIILNPDLNLEHFEWRDSPESDGLPEEGETFTTTEVTLDDISVLVNEINALKDKAVTREELDEFKKTVIGMAERAGQSFEEKLCGRILNPHSMDDVMKRLADLETFSTGAQPFINQLLVKVFPERFVGVPFTTKRDPWEGANYARDNQSGAVVKVVSHDDMHFTDSEGNTPLKIYYTPVNRVTHEPKFEMITHEEASKNYGTLLVHVNMIPQPDTWEERT